MRHLLFLAAATLLGCPGKDEPTDDTGEEPIVAGTETVSTSWDVDMYTLYESPTIARFDTLGGRRQLDGMTIAVDHAAVMTLLVENGSPIALSAEDYVFQFYFQTIMQLGAVEDDDDSPPFFGPGAFGASVSVDLPAGDDDPETEGYAYEETFTEEVQFEAHYDPVETPTYLDAMIGEEPITVVVGGFSEYWVDWINDHGGEAYLIAGVPALLYAGTLTVTYEYSPTEEEPG